MNHLLKKLLVRFALLPLVAATASLGAEDFYVAQTAKGAGTGTSAVNAYAVSFFNTASNWATGTGKIGAGDTVHLVGTITTALTVQGSGTSGSPITILFEPGSVLTSPAWGVDAAGAIYMSSKSYVTIDGASVGVIECSANGDGLAKTQPATGIFLSSCTNCAVQNLTIRNIYVHIYNTTNAIGTYTTQCIKASNCNSLTIKNNILNNAYLGVYVYTEKAIAISGFDISNNTITACSTAAVVACGSGSGDSISNINFNGNDITMGLNWYDTPNANHIDGIHTWTSGGVMSNLRIYDNYFHGQAGDHCTAQIYVTDNLTTSYIYNNIIVGSIAAPGEGYINLNLTGTANAYLFNNTIVGIGSSNTGGNGIAFDPSRAGTTAHLKNNIIMNCYIGLYDATGAITWDSDYNLFYNCGSVGRTSSFWTTLANWKTVTGGDMNSVSENPLLLNDYKIPLTSPAVGKGVNLSGYFTTDKVGTTRPATAAWDIGAFTGVAVQPTRATISITTTPL